MTYAYDQFGNLASVADPLGNATVYEYDLRGRKTYEGGATYPVRYTYDVFGNKTTMMTYQDEKGERGTGNGERGDVTTWLYDEASGAMTNKVYADGKGPKYNYTPDGKLAQRIWARGIVTDYSYDNWGNLTNTVYSDGTPTVSQSYDILGRQTEARDAAGVTTFLYDSFGSVTNETVIGVAGTNTIERFWDDYGRTAGYALNGIRQTTIGYGLGTARIETMQVHESTEPNLNSPTPTQNSNCFIWSYLPGTDLKSALAYPNGLTASWTYDANNQLLQVCNATPTNVISQYDYIYDATGRRISCAKSGSAFTQDDIVAYGYNIRSELTNAVAAVDSSYQYAYDFDDIGNRESSSERGTNSVYTANQLNQYTEISDSALSASPRETFTPQFDADGNQTLIKTSTGIWQVTYNGENRPVLWTLINSFTPNSSTPTLISMSFDRMGRRVTKNAQRFVYDGYLCIGKIEDSTSIHYSLSPIHYFVWDPTEPIATRPLVWQCGNSVEYYTHDGNKNVSEVVAENGDMAAHYEYAPFGAVIAQRGASAAVNPWRFSSEYVEDDTATVYYNYRHYEPVMGRWTQRDPIRESGGWNIYAFCSNSVALDFLGLGGIDDDLGWMIGGMWPEPPGGWAAEYERQRLERERQETESAMPDLSVIIGVSGRRNFPVGGGWGISLTANISWEFGSCCDKTENKRKEYRKLIGSISAGPYVGVAPIIEIPSPNPPEVRIDLDECPPSGESYDGFLSFKFDAGGANFECSFLFSDKKWHCGAGFSLNKITNIKLSIEGGVSYEKVTY